jgi:hypothetical protein
MIIRATPLIIKTLAGASTGKWGQTGAAGRREQGGPTVQSARVTRPLETLEGEDSRVSCIVVLPSLIPVRLFPCLQQKARLGLGDRPARVRLGEDEVAGVAAAWQPSGLQGRLPIPGQCYTGNATVFARLQSR